MSQKNPIFKEVAGSLSTRIRQRELTPGMALPSENELCRQFNISRFSVRKALDILEADGLIFRQAGVGSFVSETSQEKKKRTLNIAITGTSSYNFYAEEIYRGAQNVCSRVDARLVFTTTEEFIARNGGDMDGFILLPTHESPDSLKRLDVIAGEGIPVVLLNRYSELANIAYVTVDYGLESRRVLEFLCRMGKRKVALVNSAEGSSYANRTRSQGYSEACRAAGRHEAVCTLEHNDISAIPVLEEFLRREQPDALFVTFGDIIDYVLLACRNCGRQVGRELAVMCFDKIKSNTPERTEVMYVDMPLADMAGSAVKFIAGRGRGDDLPVLREVFNARFIFNSNSL